MSSMAITNYIPVKSQIKKQQTHYKMSPKVVRANARADFKIIPLYEKVKFSQGEYKIVMNPAMQIYQKKDIVSETKVGDDGVLSFSADVGGEQEYNVYIKIKDGENYRDVENFNFYALDGDLYNTRPYKGDMHIHSYFSDGQEDPLYVAASYRRVGFDFMAQTDHGSYPPSVYMKDFYKDYKIDLAISNGEEVHPFENPVHMINYGGSFSVNALMRENKDKYYEEVREIIKTVTDYPDMTAENEIYMYASCKWVFDRIREGGGISIFCHPYWRIGEGYHISDSLTEYILAKKDFDAYELLGGYYRTQEESNYLQLAKYNDMRANGYRIPVVGVSDSHGCDSGELMNWYGTLVFAKSPALADIKEAVVNFRSVAIETMPGNALRVFGEFRYVAYAYFVLREIFPFHDILCSAEGALMYRVSIGDKTAKAPLEALSGSCEKYLDEIWGTEK